MKQWNKCSKTILAMGVAAMVFGGATTTEAASNFLAEVPANDWSYETANSLISAGVVPDYDMAIPQGRVLSRLEMAMIVQQAVGNENAMTDEQKAATEKLKEAYYYDMKKLSLLNKLDTLDNSQVQSIENGGKAAGGDSFTPEERAGLKRAAELADKLTVNGYVRVRNDHFLKDKKDGTGEKRSTRANMIHVAVDTTYKINENWQGHADIGYRNSLSGFEWNIYGWGMDIDCDFSGFQFRQGKKDFKTYFTAGQMDLWDDAMGGDRTKEKVTSLRFFYPFDKKNDVNFGMSWSSPMQSRYQADDQHRVFYYYAHGHHKFDKNWDLRAGMIASNAKRDPTNEAAGTKNKQPGRWVQLTYKQAQLQNPGTYSIVADYRYEPALSWPTVTDWCGLNERFLRLGFNYVPAKNILLDTFYQWARDIDTGAKDDLYRFQAQFFF